MVVSCSAMMSASEICEIRGRIAGFWETEDELKVIKVHVQPVSSIRDVCDETGMCRL